jgi:hypothetical protein
MLTDELVNGLRTMARDIDTNFAHCRDRFRADMGRFYTGAFYIVLFGIERAQDSFGHLASRRVAGAEN